MHWPVRLFVCDEWDCDLFGGSVCWLGGVNLCRVGCGEIGYSVG